MQSADELQKIMSPSLYIQGNNYLKKLKTENKAGWENARHPEGEEKSREVTKRQGET